MQVKIVFDLDDIYVDEFRPIHNQPILNVISDIQRLQNLITNKVSEDFRTSEIFRDLNIIFCL